MPASASLSQHLKRAIEAASPRADARRRLSQSDPVTAILTEVDETVLPRHLVFTAPNGATLAVEARGRRIVALTDPVTAALVRAGPGGGLPESVAGLAAMKTALVTFSRYGGPLTVVSERSRLAAHVVDPGFQPSDFAELAAGEIPAGATAVASGHVDPAPPEGQDGAPDGGATQDPPQADAREGDAVTETAPAPAEPAPAAASGEARHDLRGAVPGSAEAVFLVDDEGALEDCRGDEGLAGALAGPLCRQMRSLANEAAVLLPQPRLVVMMRRAPEAPALCIAAENGGTAAAVVGRKDIAALIAMWSGADA